MLSGSLQSPTVTGRNTTLCMIYSFLVTSISSWGLTCLLPSGFCHCVSLTCCVWDEPDEILVTITRECVVDQRAGKRHHPTSSQQPNVLKMQQHVDTWYHMWAIAVVRCLCQNCVSHKSKVTTHLIHYYLLLIVVYIKMKTREVIWTWSAEVNNSAAGHLECQPLSE